MLCLWLIPPWFNLWFSFILAGNVCRISQEYSSFFNHSDYFVVFVCVCVCVCVDRLSRL